MPRVKDRCHAYIVRAKQVPCARCGRRYPSVCMDFDHLPQYPKAFNIGTPKYWTSVGRIAGEIAKTQVLCSNCHRIVTWQRKNLDTAHRCYVRRGPNDGDWRVSCPGCKGHLSSHELWITAIEAALAHIMRYSRQ